MNPEDSSQALGPVLVTHDFESAEIESIPAGATIIGEIAHRGDTPKRDGNGITDLGSDLINDATCTDHT